MEKADILEMTVAYLQSLYHCLPASVNFDSGTTDMSVGGGSGGGKYADGYRQCAVEVAQYLSSVAARGSSDGATVNSVQTKLLRHLTAVLQTKLVQPTDVVADQLSATSLPSETEVASRACDSSSCDRWAGSESVGSAENSDPCRRGSDVDDVGPESPTSSGSACPALSPSLPSLSPPVSDLATVESPSSVSQADPPTADVNLLWTGSADCCVWRPW